MYEGTRYGCVKRSFRREQHRTGSLAASVFQTGTDWKNKYERRDLRELRYCCSAAQLLRKDLIVYSLIAIAITLLYVFSGSTARQLV
jgi:hypothetical protein